MKKRYLERVSLLRELCENRLFSIPWCKGKEVFLKSNKKCDERTFFAYKTPFLPLFHVQVCPEKALRGLVIGGREASG